MKSTDLIVGEKEKISMPTDTSTNTSTKRAPFSLDTWAVIVAIIMALAVKFDIFKSVPW